MNKKHYEIWVNEGSQTWKIFVDVNEDLQRILTQTGWTSSITFDETEMDNHMRKPVKEASN